MTFMFETTCLLKPHVWENLVLELNAKMLSANQIAGFLNFNISKTIGVIKLIFSMQVHRQIDDVILCGRGRA